MIKALRFLWAVQGTPCGRLLAAALPDLVPRLRRLGELNVDDETATLLLQIDEPSLPAVLSGAVPTEGGYFRHRAVEASEAAERLA